MTTVDTTQPSPIFDTKLVVVLRDAALLSRWDAHDWRGLFWDARAAWSDGTIRAEVFGHALLEMALVPGKLITGKAIALLDESAAERGDAIATLAQAIARGDVLNDPQAVPRAFVSTYEKVGLVRGDTTLVLGPRRTLAAYAGLSKRPRADIDPELETDAIAYFQSASGWSQRSRRLDTLLHVD